MAIFEHMLYAVLKILARLTVFGYFRKVHVTGKQNIPKKGPYLFVANHPSAFMDPIVVATTVRPALYFIAAGEYMGKGVKAWFFKRFLHMIPVYRPSTRPEDLHKNKDLFDQCYAHLSGGGALLIFPEGVSLTEKKLKPLKTGAARILIGAEKMNAFKLGVPIIPIGLNYSNPHQFRSELYINISAPIRLNDFNNELLEDEINLARMITQHTEKELRQSVLHVEYDEDELLLDQLQAVYAADFKREFAISPENLTANFQMQQEFIEAISFFKENEPQAYRTATQRLETYLNKLKDQHLTDQDIRHANTEQQKGKWLPYLAGAPLFALGWIHNYLPYRLTGWIADRLKIDKTFSGSIRLALGLFLFFGWYTFLTLMAWPLLGFTALLYPVCAYISGIYALLYASSFKRYLRQRKIEHIRKRTPETINNLIKERAALIAFFSTKRHDYVTSEASLATV